MVSEAFPAYLLGTRPNSQIILSTYGQTFAETWGRKARDLMSAYGPALYGQRVRDDSASVSEWRIAGKRGVMYAVGVGGSTTGKRADYAIIDDPVKNAKEAESPVFQAALYDWFQRVLYTRLTPTGCIILCMTRWTHNDLAGKLLSPPDGSKPLPWRVINLPALAEDADELGRQPGAALWPEMYDAKRLEEVRATLTDHQWLAMYQQRPTPEKGSVYHRDWFDQRYDSVTPRFGRVILTVDSAFKDGVGADYTAIEAWAATRTGYFLLDCLNEKLEYPDLIQAIKDWAAREYGTAKQRPDGIYIEDKASGQSAIQTLRRETRLAIIAVPAKISKVARAEGNTPKWRAGRIWLPRSAEWVADFIQQHVQFPRAANDDMVDGGNIALDVLSPGDVQYTDESVLDLEPSRMDVILSQYEQVGSLSSLILGE